MAYNVGDNVYMTPNVFDLSPMENLGPSEWLIIKGTGGPITIDGQTLIVDEVGNVVDIPEE